MRYNHLCVYLSVVWSEPAHNELLTRAKCGGRAARQTVWRPSRTVLPALEHSVTQPHCNWVEPRSSVIGGSGRPARQGQGRLPLGRGAADGSMGASPAAGAHQIGGRSHLRPVGVMGAAL